MRCLGMDVHVKSTAWCLLDGSGEIVEKGKSPTTAAELSGLIQRLAKDEPLVAAQECGKLSHFVHDVLSPLDVKLLTFNPYHLRVIAASRKQTDKRDAYWLAKTVQSGMTPHPVYIPTGIVRQLRALLNERDTVTGQRKAWLVRAGALLQAAGLDERHHSGKGWIEKLLQQPDGIDEQLKLALERCERMALALTDELVVIDARLHQHAKSLEQVQRLQTVPAIGEKVALTIYAWVGDISRFHTARQLCAYAGLTPSVRQSGNSSVTGRITKEGSKQLRLCAHPGGAHPLVSLPIRKLSPPESQAGAHHGASCTAKDRRRGSSPAHLAHSLLRHARPNRLRPSSIELACSDNPSSLVKHVSEAEAGEDEGDQIASPYGSRPALPGARSPRLDWSVLLPVRQHVPSHLGEPEHEWKDENPWPSAPDLDLSDHNTCQHQGAPPSGSAAAKVRAIRRTKA